MGRIGEGQEGGVVHELDGIEIFEDKNIVSCTCGASWSHSKSDDINKIYSIMESHKAYFNRPKTETL